MVGLRVTAPNTEVRHLRGNKVFMTANLKNTEANKNAKRVY